MKKLISVFLGSLFLCGINNLHAQHESCGFDHQQKAFFESNPQAEVEHLKARKRMSKAPIQRENRYVIPVVFHVYGTKFNNGSTTPVTVTLDLIKDALAKTNKDFQGLTSDYDQAGQPSSRFENIKKPLNFEFRLAQIDPDGRPTTGVEFFEEKSGFGNGGGYDEEIQKYAWDNTRYMNVYIMNDLYADGDIYQSGVAWLPNMGMTNSNTARVVYNGNYIGQNTNENFRRVLTHEFGHFMGLHHTFEGGCTMPNDGVEDTPAVKTSKWPKDQKNCFNEYTDWENFMNYTDNYRHYTAGQVDLMEQYLHEQARKTLWQEENLTVTGTNDGYINKPTVIAGAKVFSETIENKGVVSGAVTIEGYYGMEFSKIGTLVLGTDYIIEGLPEGLTPVLTVTSTTKSTLTLTGAATQHALSNTIEGINTVLKAACLKAIGVTITDVDFTFDVFFKDPYTSLCSFTPRFSPCAYISNVKFGKIDKSTEFDGQQWADFSEKQVAGLKVGETYNMAVTMVNYNSGDKDNYKIRLWVDWNGDYVLQEDEMMGVRNINKVGALGSNHTVNFEVTVPADVVQGDQEFKFRLMLYYSGGAASVPTTDGTDPCGTIDSGEVEDYGAVIGEGHVENIVEPDPDEVCTPVLSWLYSYISKVELNGMVNETTTTKAEARTMEDFRNRENLQVKLEKGKTYTAKIACTNFDSGNVDPYKARLYFDWNNNKRLEKSESQVVEIPEIGMNGKTHNIEFQVTVPENAVENEFLHMRAFFHFGKGMAGDLPCGTVESGQFEEYYVYIGEKPTVGIDSNATEILTVYPNPTKGVLSISNRESMIGYSLFTIDGKLVQRANAAVETIDISSNDKGMYILKIEIENGSQQKIVILE